VKTVKRAMFSESIDSDIIIDVGDDVARVYVTYELLGTEYKRVLFSGSSDTPMFYAIYGLSAGEFDSLEELQSNLNEFLIEHEA